ncbi:GNAT family N-acetyltransferase [Nibrella saemangeumensis]|uniref:GNAT family N-acetyltransferase n=1 Tax=Nibrella saemangeumensis TaxID=1084526 RepID=A0ABP8MK84_9BACT
MKVNLRIATVDDIPAIIRMQEQTWEPTYREILSREQIDYMFDRMYSDSSLKEQMTQLGHTFVVAEEDSVVLGFASFNRIDATKQVYKLQKIYVLPGTQGSGVGRLLLDEVESQCRERGGQTLWLNVNRYNRAITFYKRQGFSVLREEDIPVGPYWMNDYLMEKALE